MNVLGVILARAGSVGLKNKHLLPLLGRPVIEYTFDHAAAANRLSRVVVSTDCPGVTRLAERRGLQVIERPACLATSDAAVQDVLLHALDCVERQSDWVADAVVCLYGNVPVRGDGVIDTAIRLLEWTSCDSVRSFCPVGKWHPAWMSRIEGNRCEAVVPGSVHRRQDLPSLFLHDGAVVDASRPADADRSARIFRRRPPGGADRNGRDRRNRLAA